jgi:hypothetical protein
LNIAVDASGLRCHTASVYEHGDESIRYSYSKDKIPIGGGVVAHYLNHYWRVVPTQMGDVYAVAASIIPAESEPSSSPCSRPQRATKSTWSKYAFEEDQHSYFVNRTGGMKRKQPPNHSDPPIVQICHQRSIAV